LDARVRFSPLFCLHARAPTVLHGVSRRGLFLLSHCGSPNACYPCQQGSAVTFAALGVGRLQTGAYIASRDGVGNF